MTASGTQRTYAYLLVDHLRWLDRECLALDRVGLRDLQRYMGLLGAEVRMPLGEPWRVGKRPYGPAALSITASCLKGFYLHQRCSRREHGARQGAGPLPVTVAGGPAPPVPRPHHDGAAGEPARTARPHGGGIRRCCPTAHATSCSTR